MDDLEEEVRDVVDMRRDPDDRLNSWALIITDGFAGMLRWMMGLTFFLFDVVMAVSGEGIQRPHVLGVVLYISVHVEYTMYAPCRAILME